MDGKKLKRKENNTNHYKVAITDKQKLKSIEKKMERIQNSMPFFDFKFACRNITEINRFHQLEREHFFLKFEIEHCKTCGKKL